MARRKRRTARQIAIDKEKQRIIDIEKTKQARENWRRYLEAKKKREADKEWGYIRDGEFGETKIKALVKGLGLTLKALNPMYRLPVLPTLSVDSGINYSKTDIRAGMPKLPKKFVAVRSAKKAKRLEPEKQFDKKLKAWKVRQEQIQTEYEMQRDSWEAGELKYKPVYPKVTPPPTRNKVTGYTTDKAYQERRAKLGEKVYLAKKNIIEGVQILETPQVYKSAKLPETKISKQFIKDFVRSTKLLYTDVSNPKTKRGQRQIKRRTDRKAEIGLLLNHLGLNIKEPLDATTGLNTLGFVKFLKPSRVFDWERVYNVFKKGTSRGKAVSDGGGYRW